MSSAAAALGKPSGSDAIGLSSLNVDDGELAAGYLGLFAKPSVDSLLQKATQVELQPLHVPQVGQPLEFVVGGYHDKFLDMSSIRLCGNISLKKVGAGGALGDIQDSDDVSFTSIFPLAMYKSLSVQVNGTEVMDMSYPCYPFKVLVDCLCSYDESAKKMVLSTLYYTPETVNKEDITVAASGDGSGEVAFNVRKAFIPKNKSCQFLTNVFAEFFHTQKLLIPGIQIRLKWLPSEPTFPLISAKANADKFKLVLNDAKLMFKLITVDPSIITSMVTRLDRDELALYPFCRTSVTVHTIKSGVTSETIPYLFSGPLPSQILTCFLDNDNFEGYIDANPFHFSHHDVVNFTYYKNGDPVVRFTPNFSEDRYLEVYQAFLDLLSIQRGNFGLGITKESFKSNSCFFAYDDLPDNCNNAHLHLQSASSTGLIAASVSFKTALAKPLKMLCFASHYKTLTIDKNLNTNLMSTV